MSRIKVMAACFFEIAESEVEIKRRQLANPRKLRQASKPESTPQSDDAEPDFMWDMAMRGSRLKEIDQTRIRRQSCKLAGYRTAPKSLIAAGLCIDREKICLEKSGSFPSVKQSNIRNTHMYQQVIHFAR